jgi:hypothetical protein
MSAHILLLALGGLLIVVAILGGGIEAREIRIPQIGKWPRVLAGLAGMFFFVLGMGLIPDGQTHITPAPDPVTFKIKDELGKGQFSEQVRIVINGKEAGYLTVNEDYPVSTISVSVPRAGQYSYVLEADALFHDKVEVEKLNNYQGGGQGSIDVKEGKLFELVGAVATGGVWQAHLEEAQEQ